MEALQRHSNITVHMEDKDDGCSLQLSLSQTLLKLMCVRACRGCYILKKLCVSIKEYKSTCIYIFIS